MASYTTHKATTRGKERTIERRTVRAVKYQSAARITTAGRAR